LNTLNMHDMFALGGFALAVMLLLLYLFHVLRLRRRDQSMGRFLLSSPFWLIRPRAYFVDSKVSPRRAFFWWCVALLLITTLADRIPRWLEY
jgi:hypothetical protein